MISDCKIFPEAYVGAQCRGMRARECPKGGAGGHRAELLHHSDAQGFVDHLSLCPGDQWGPEDLHRAGVVAVIGMRGSVETLEAPEVLEGGGLLAGS